MFRNRNTCFERNTALTVQNMVCREQRDHADADDLMGLFTYQRIAHEDRQQHDHGHVDTHTDHVLSFHAF